VAWPHLAEPFASAIKQAVDFLFSETDPIGIVAAGTIIRGTAHANSDLDLYVI
jgi:UTP:GlnB (protein PII) uridylyltransferase